MEIPVAFTITTADDLPQDRPSLAGLSQRALEAYRQLLINRGSTSNVAEPAEHVDTERLMSEYGRLKVWIEQTGSAVVGRGSLEDILQHDPDLRDNISSVLQRIATQLSSALDLALKTGNASLASEQDASSNYTTDSEYSADSQNSIGQSQRPKISRFSLILIHVFENIGLLYQYSTILRRPRLRDRYIHSKSSEEKPDSLPSDYSHVEHKLKSWLRYETAAAKSEKDGSGDDTAVTAEDVSSRMRVLQEGSGNDFNRLCVRLARANLRRRQQLIYWRGHSYESGERAIGDQTGSENGPQTDVESQASHVSGGKSLASKRTTNTNPTVHTFSSVARSAIYETSTVAGPSRTVYQDSVIGNDKKVKRLPKVPEESKTATSFECPYCHMMLDSAPMHDRTTWKRHVFRDLRPYTCTFPKCANEDKLYATRRDWIYHEMQMHRRQWNCRICHDRFANRDLMSTHLKESHASAWNDSQLPVLLEVSEGPVDDGTAQRCPFCQEEMAVKRLMDHIAGHLEELSLFVLPTDEHGDLPDEESSGILSSLDSEADDIPQSADLDPDPLFEAPNPIAANVHSISPQMSPIVRPTYDGQSMNVIDYRATKMPGPEDAEPEDAQPLDQFASPQFQDKKVLNPDSSLAEAPLVFRCNFKDCGREFDQIHKLNHHMRYHERPHECPYPGCGRRFGTKTHLDRHINDKHIIQRKYHCLVADCHYSKAGGKSFPRKDNWRRHLQNKHQITPSFDPDPDLIEDPEPY